MMMIYFRSSMLNNYSCMSNQFMASKKCCCKIHLSMQEETDVN